MSNQNVSNRPVLKRSVSYQTIFIPDCNCCRRRIVDRRSKPISNSNKNGKLYCPGCKEFHDGNTKNKTDGVTQGCIVCVPRRNYN